MFWRIIGFDNFEVVTFKQFAVMEVGMIDNMEECGCACGITSAGLGTAVQYVGNPKKKEETSYAQAA